MSKQEITRQLFEDYTFLSDKQRLLHRDLERVRTTLINYQLAEPAVQEAYEIHQNLQKKSAVYFREFEKLRIELNNFKNDSNALLKTGEELRSKIDFIEGKQSEFGDQIADLKRKTASIRSRLTEMELPVMEPKPDAEAKQKSIAEPNLEPERIEEPVQQRSSTLESEVKNDLPKPPKSNSSPVSEAVAAEEFIGQKLFSYIGIGILIIGLGYGAKVAIDKNLIGPGMRIVLAYLASGALIGLGLWLRKKYDAFGAVLLGGGLASTYFTTYAAHSFYGYIDRIPAFGIMVLLTGLTIYFALKYNKELIAILGLVGAYGVPFLLSDGSGKVDVLFAYMAIINIGILVIAFKKYWRALYYSAFGLTLLIFVVWFESAYSLFGISSGFGWTHPVVAMVFASIFYLTFYATFLAHKLIQNETFNAGDIALTLINSFFFFAIGVAVLNSHPVGKEYLGIFALINAAFHFIITLVFYKRNWADKGMFYVEAGMVLLFVSIAIPLQFEGKWIPVFWTLEALILFWVGRTKGIKVYEVLSYPVIFLAFFSVAKSLITDYQPYWSQFRGMKTSLPFLFNEVFLGSIIAVIGFGALALINRNKSTRPEQPTSWQLTLDYFLPIMAIAIGFFAFFAEINAYWMQLYHDSKIPLSDDASWYESWFSRDKNSDILKYRTISLINYSVLFFTILGALNWKFWKNRNFGIMVMGASLLALFVFLLAGVDTFTELGAAIRDQQNGSVLNWRKSFPVNTKTVYSLKYASLVVFILCAIIQWMSARALNLGKTWMQWNAGILHLFALILISHEFLFLTEIANYSNSAKLALSILWGVYASVLMFIGMRRDAMYLRIAAFVLFGIVVLKLLFFDIGKMSPEVTTLAFISVGALLLIVSFLYYRNKRKKESSGDTE